MTMMVLQKTKAIATITIQVFFQEQQKFVTMGLIKIVMEVIVNETTATISTVGITYYEDAGGVPGALIGTETLVPSSQTVVGSNFGYNVSEVVLDISPVNFTEGTYWIGTRAVSSTGGLTAWETTSTSSIGADSAFSQDEGVSWGFSNSGDGVFTLSGICSD